ncbi:MAG: isoprenylcysteine carboxylmethyltransferase family protein [Patescibacteria group bacterium]|nr:isoprenylcysteine carboxylmethyltransferase family protein [Patescibacteria group bacterium]
MIYYDLPFIVAYVLFVATFFIRELFLRRGKEAKALKGSRYDKGTTLMTGILIILVLISPLYLNFFKNNILTQLQWFGVVLVILGTIIHDFALMTLGKFYGRTLLIQTNHKLIIKGLYKFVRHPGYLGTILMIIGVGLSTGNVIILLFFLILVTSIYVLRIKKEEEMLFDKFGDEYKNYQKKTWRLVPYFY